jgi:predicted XRE-type DNA-binding protein
MSKEMIDVTRGRNNIFDDLGFEPQEAIHLKIRADLMLDLRSYIQDQGWSTQEAAAFFGETSIMITHLVEGEIDQFTVDQLIALLGKAGMKVEVKVIAKAA